MPKARVAKPRRKAQFLTSASHLSECPPTELPEIAFLGRSNAGKSSLVNAWIGADVAKVSSTPGKTTLLNFFSVEDKYVMVDLPGYGFAARSEDERVGWRRLIEAYLKARHHLVATILVFDCRREWSADEASLVTWLTKKSLPVVLALTKADKLNQSEMVKVVRKFQVEHGLAGVFLTSSLKNRGLVELEEFVFNRWLKE